MMNEKRDSKDETEAVCEPIIRLADMINVPGQGSAASGKGKLDASRDQTEPCGFAPITKLQAEEEDGPDENSPSR